MTTARRSRANAAGDVVVLVVAGSPLADVAADPAQPHADVFPRPRYGERDALESR